VTAHRARATLSVLLPLLVSLMLPALPALPALPVSAADPPSASATAVAMPPTTADIPTPAPGAYSPAIWHSPDANRLKYGIAGHMWWLDAHLDEFIAYYHQLGITNVRLSIDWKRFEAQQGQYDFAQFDRVLNRLAAENIEVLGSFVTEPPWAATDPARCAQAQATPDREPHDCAINPAFEPQFRAAVRAVAMRYPSIRLWEFWNEPELWEGMGHEVGDYLRWLKPFYEEMHAVNPGSVVAANTLAGVFYIDWLYGASDSTNGPAKRPWDAISYHPYGALMKSGPDGKTTGIIPGPIEDVRKRMVDAGDANKKLWITEYGWETDAESASRYLTGTASTMACSPPCHRSTTRAMTSPRKRSSCPRNHISARTVISLSPLRRACRVRRECASLPRRGIRCSQSFVLRGKGRGAWQRSVCHAPPNTPGVILSAACSSARRTSSVDD